MLTRASKRESGRSLARNRQGVLCDPGAAQAREQRATQRGSGVSVLPLYVDFAFRGGPHKPGKRADTASTQGGATARDSTHLYDGRVAFSPPLPTLPRMARHSLRDDIFASAMKLFLKHGFNYSSVHDITSDAGVPKGSFYNHFESKEALGAEVVSAYWPAICECTTILADARVAPLRRLKRYFEVVNNHFAEHDFAEGCMIGNFSAELSAQSELIRSRLADVYASWTQAIEVAIKAGQSDGSIPRQVRAAELATFLLGAWEGALLRARVERRREPLDVFAKVMIKKILC
ncbi:MAG TPA: TetR family transcriptional regulator C-terminal domain-containing protein [Pararobbsia sp.]|nr:TetR family transcriptional regulator C-terminal domain-containing protein [Pararobbsia sp.]